MGRKHDVASVMRHFPPADELILESVKEDILDIKANKLNYLLMSHHQHAGQKEKKTEG
jgi:hypothetical protein